MVMVFSPEEKQLSRIAASVRPVAEVVATSDWGAVEAGTESQNCLVAAIDWLPGNPHFARLTALKARRPALAVVLVTRWERENARLLKGLKLEEVVWTMEIPRELAPAVQATCAHEYNFVRCLAAPLRLAGWIPASLREGLARACESDTPVRTVNQLAAIVGCDRRTLWYQWQQSMDGRAGLRLQDFLHWLLVLRAFGRKTPDRSWSRVASDIGVHSATLARYVRQLAGAGLNEMTDADTMRLAEEFREKWIELLAAPGALDKL